MIPDPAFVTFCWLIFLQDPQPSPLALLAATCSKIGHPGSEGSQQGQPGQQYKVIGPQGQVIQTADLSQIAQLQQQHQQQQATTWIVDQTGNNSYIGLILRD